MCTCTIIYSLESLARDIHFVSTGEFPSHQNIHVLHFSPNAPALCVMPNLEKRVLIWSVPSAAIFFKMSDWPTNPTLGIARCCPPFYPNVIRSTFSILPCLLLECNSGLGGLGKAGSPHRAYEGLRLLAQRTWSQIPAPPLIFWETWVSTHLSQTF